MSSEIHVTAGETIDPGPSVADLAEAVGEQPLRQRDEPVGIEVDGYKGLRWNWRYSMIRTTDCAGMSTSTVGTVGIKQGPGQVERLWIVDIYRERLEKNVTNMPNAEQRLIAKNWGMPWTPSVSSSTDQRAGPPQLVSALLFQSSFVPVRDRSPDADASLVS